MTRRGFLIELVVMYALACMAGYLLNGGDFAFVDVPLHPFLLVVAIIGIQYGVTEAMLATGTGLVLYLIGLRIETGSLGLGGSNHPFILFSFVATGMLLGLTQESRNRQLRQTRSELEDVRNEAERLRGRLQVVTAANQALNERILGEVSTVQSFSEIARRLSVLEEADLYPAVCELTLDFVHATEASVYMLSGSDKLVLTAQRGWDNVPAEAAVLARGNDLLWTAIDQKKAVTGLDLDAPPPAGEDTERRFLRLICAPIVHPVTGQAVGVVSVDRLPFAHFHANSISVLGVIAKWAGDSLYNAATFREVANQLAGDDVIKGCVPPVLFRDRLQQEVTRKESAALVSLYLSGYHVLEPDGQVSLRQGIADALTRTLEARAVVGRLEQGLYAVLLPEKGEPDAERLREQLLGILREHVKPTLDARVTLMSASWAVARADGLEELVAAATDSQRLKAC